MSLLLHARSVLAAQQPALAWVARSLSTAAAAAAPEAGAGAGAAAQPVLQRKKDKNHFKRASEVMAAVTRDAATRMAVKMATFRPPIADFNVGDAVEITYAQELPEAKPLPIRGTVMAKANKGLDAKFTVINSWDGEWYTASYPLSSPLLRGVKVLQRNRLTEGLRRAKRAKLTDLKEADPNRYLVDENTKEAALAQAEKEERRRLARAGKLGVAKKAAKEALRGGKGKGDDKAAAAAGKGDDKAKGGAKAAAPAAAAKGGAKK